MRTAAKRLHTSTVVSGTISGAGGSLMKVGAGTLTLNGANTYTGFTTIEGGRLQVDSALRGPSAPLAMGGGAGLRGGTTQPNVAPDSARICAFREVLPTDRSRQLNWVVRRRK